MSEFSGEPVNVIEAREEPPDTDTSDRAQVQAVDARIIFTDGSQTYAFLEPDTIKQIADDMVQGREIGAYPALSVIKPTKDREGGYITYSLALRLTDVRFVG